MWLLILASMIGVCLAMLCLVALERKIFNTESENIFSHSALWVMQTLSQESRFRMTIHIIYLLT